MGLSTYHVAARFSRSRTENSDSLLSSCQQIIVIAFSFTITIAYAINYGEAPSNQNYKKQELQAECLRYCNPRRKRVILARSTICLTILKAPERYCRDYLLNLGLLSTTYSNDR